SGELGELILEAFLVVPAVRLAEGELTARCPCPFGPGPASRVCDREQGRPDVLCASLDTFGYLGVGCRYLVTDLRCPPSEPYFRLGGGVLAVPCEFRGAVLAA